MTVCNITPKDVLVASPLTNEVRFCELCDNPTMWDYCGIAEEDVCLVCHDGDVFDGWGFSGYHE